MNYCTYFKSTGKIYNLNPNPVETDELDFIEIDFHLIGEFLSGKKQLFKYVVIPDYAVPHTGKIVEESTLLQSWARRDAVLYKVPHTHDGDLVIIQDTVNKVCSFKISKLGLITLTNKRIPVLTVAACLHNDPFVPLWVWNFDPATETSINYSGTDNFQLYTHRQLEHYSHVVI